MLFFLLYSFFFSLVIGCFSCTPRVYLQLRQPSWRIPAVRVAFQTVFLALGVLTCVTRITDNKHHQTDVLAGAVLGFFVALSVPFYMCHLFPSQPNNSVRVLCPFRAEEKY
ncbi:hypothetical protein PHET_10670 [Paragonimus heterotremus]|uniref:Phosphatidic acid phosphatase type 2/haloperoxidase domain-containing protein n=1 Tax=Paragonimus heterotremus TaxID=100268 RepID=A0A8J4WDX7_9TREM|nr:hypothetical protein PHET_10670 [Paragonimus heterotremus]